MAEFLANAIQTVQPNQNVLFNTSIPCPNGYVIHRPESGIITLRGIVNNPCAGFARYHCAFNANIGLPEGATVGEIGIALAIDGEAIQTSRALFTPADVDEYGNVTSVATVTIPKGCCYTIAVENVSVSSDPSTVPAPEINVQNANLTISRIA